MAKKNLFLVVLLTFLSILMAGSGWSSGEKPKAADGLKADAKPSEIFGKLPLYFIENKGQADQKVKFFEQGGGHATFFTKDGIYLSLLKKSNSPDNKEHKAEVVKLSLLDSNKNPGISPEGIQHGQVNYYIGKNKNNWKTNVPTYSAVRYKDVYKGIDVKYYGNNSQIEYDIVVRAGADPSNIRFAYEGIKNLKVDGSGDLVITLDDDGVIVQKKPYAYQEINGKKIEVAGSFDVSRIPSAKNAEPPKYAYGFKLASYDKSRELIIDPTLVYSTYLGGSGYDEGLDIALDGSGNIIVSGYTNSTNFPTSSPIQSSVNGTTQDVFITKLSPSGSLVFSTYLGGSADDRGYGVAVDGSGNIYVGGATNSTDFPVLSPIQSAYAGGGFDAFALKINASGSLAYSTFIGGTGDERAYAIAADSAGSVYLTGATNSIDFPGASPYQAANAGGWDVFVTKINPAGNALSYSTYIGGASNDYSSAIAVDSTGMAYITGYTMSNNYPTAVPADATCGSCTSSNSNAFVTRLSPSGWMSYSTFLGGSTNDRATGIAVDAVGDAYVTGYTNSPDFPTMGAIQSVNAGSYDAFLTKFDPNGRYKYSTLLGGSGTDYANGVTVDSSGNAYVTGYTHSSNFPTASPLQTQNSGAPDAFAAKINASGNAILFSTYFGGSSKDIANRIVSDNSGNLYMTGVTNSNNFPTASGMQGVNAGGQDAFIVKMSTNLPPSLSYTTEAGFTNGVTPSTGSSSTNFTFKVVYTDQDNQASSSVNVCIDGICNPMSLDTGAASTLKDGKYLNGEQYTYSTTLLSGSHSYYFTASDSVDSARLPATGSVTGPAISTLAITTTTLPDGGMGVAYNASLTASGGTAPYTWSIPSGGLPPGLSINGSTGVISGTPTAASAFGFTVKVTDSASVTYTKTLTITISSDTIAPTGTIDINNGASSVNTTGVTLNLSATDNSGIVANMRFSTDGTAWGAWEAYSTSKAWTLTAGEGTKTVFVQYNDAAGNISTAATHSIILDTVAPTVTASPVGGLYNAAQTVTLTANETATIYYTVDGSNPTAASTAYSAPIAVANSLTLKYIAIDTAGNASAVQSQAYTIDTVAPTGTIDINNGTTTVNTTAVTLNLSATDNSGTVANMRFSTDGTTWGAWEAYATAKAYTLSAGDGTKTVHVQYNDAAGNISTAASHSIILDTVAPTVTASPVGGLYNAAQNVTLTANETATIYYTVDGSNPTAASTAYSAPIAVANSLTLKYIAIDTAGNSSAVQSQAYTIDTIAPTGTIDINSGATAVNTTTVILNLSATDNSGTVANMRFSTDGTTWGAWEAYATAKAYTLSAGDGTKTVHVQYNDAAGNISTAASHSIILDTAAPTVSASPEGGLYNSAQSVRVSANETATIYYTIDGSNPTTASTAYSAPIAVANSLTLKYIAIDTAGNASAVQSQAYTIDSVAPTGSIDINNGALAVNTTSVILNLSATDNSGTVAYMRFSTDGTTWGAWEAYATTKAYTLSTGDGTKTVFVQYNDAAGNISTAASHSIILDTAAPTVSASPEGGLYNSAQSVRVSANETATIYYTIDGSNPTSASTAYSAPIAVANSLTLKYIAIDTAGNSSAVQSQAYTIDTVAPTSSIDINSGASSVNTTAVTLNLSATDNSGTVANMRFSTDGTTWGAWEAYATAKAYTLSTGDGTKTVFVQYNDAAGNISTAASHSIILDTVAPTVTASPVGGLYNAAQNVTLIANETATIYYTIDGSNPTSASTTYSAPVAIANSLTLKYIAIDISGNSSAVQSQAYTIDTIAPTVTASLAGGLYNAAQNVTLTANEPATIYYTTDGTNPTSASTAYSAPIVVASSITLKYIAIDTAGNSSAIGTQSYTIDNIVPTGSININNGASAVNITAVTLNLSATDNSGTVANMRFSTDGTAWGAWEAYATLKAFTLSGEDGAKTVYVQYNDVAGNVSEIYSHSITLDTGAPVITATPAGGSYETAQTVTLTASEPATIYYTVNGSAPTTSSTVYSAPIQVNVSLILKYFAVDNGGNSVVQSQSYTIDSTAPTGSININNGAMAVSTNSVTLNLTATDNSGTVAGMRFSADGSNWTAWEAYATTKAWSLSAGDGGKTVYVQYKDGAGNISVSYTHSIVLDTIAPIVSASPSGGIFGGIQTVSLVANEFANIYYTIDSSTPTTSSLVYLSPLNVPTTTTVKFFGVDNAGNVSAIRTETYTIGTNTDFIVTGLSAPPSGVTGTAITVTSTVTNQGAGTSVSSILKYYISASPNVTISDTFLGQLNMGPLAAGASSTTTQTFTIPVSLPTGNYYVGAIADATNTNAETNETNNTVSTPISLTTGVDLIMSSLVVPATAVNGVTISITNTVANQGTGTSAVSNAYFYLSTSPNGTTSDTYLGERNVAALSGGSSSSSTQTFSLAASLSPGNYYIIAKADGGNTNAEINETNNTASAPVTVTSGIDLVITGVSGPLSVATGTSISVTSTVANQGTGTSSNSSVYFYLATGTTVTPSDIYLGQRNVSSLAPNASSTSTQPITLPATITQGNYYIVAIADAANTNAESNEANNTGSAPISITSGIDFDISVSAPSSGTTGTNLTFSNTVTNQGTGSSATTSVYFYISTTPTGAGSDIYLGQRSVSSLAAGASSATSQTFQLPVTLAPGNYYVLAKVDPNNTNAELNELNNIAASAIAISSGVDFMTTVSGPSSASTGASIFVTNTVANQGAGTSANSTVYFYLSTSPTPSTSDTYLGQRSVAALAPGASSTATQSFTLPASLAGGNYYIGAIVDPANTNIESNESNNAASSPIAIISGIDLVVSSLGVPSTGITGSNISVINTVTNQGSGTSASSSLYFYLSTTPAGTDIFLGQRSVAGLAGGSSSSSTQSFSLPVTISPGNYYLVAIADAVNTNSEANETNNTAYSPIAISSGVDLVVTVNAPATGLTGKTISVTNTVANTGSGTSASSSVFFYISTSPTPSSSDIYLGQRAVSPLAPGAISMTTQSFTLPVTIAPGNYYVTAMVDLSNTNKESDETNNTFASQISISSGVDLLIVSISSPTTGATGTSVSVPNTVTNLGSGTSASTSVRFYISTSPNVTTSDIYLGQRSVPALAGGASSTSTQTLTLPVSLPAGNYYIGGIVDTSNMNVEYNELNNMTSTMISLTSGVDLIVSSLSAPSSAAAGSYVSVPNTVTNQGVGTSAYSSVSFYISSSPNVTSSDTYLGQRALSAVIGGGANTATTSLRIPSTLAPGTYYIGAIADTTYTNAESNESNNMTSVEITVQ